MKDEYLTIKEVAQLLKVSTRTIKRWIDKDILPATKIESTVRINKLDIPTYERSKK